ncbi:MULTISPECIES: hypothetical protein [Cyanophyceae]|nr:hypothetical protein [Nodosilinea sp. FACHB-141]
MNLKPYQPMQVQELGSLASLTQGMFALYNDGDSGMGMVVDMGND